MDKLQIALCVLIGLALIATVAHYATKTQEGVIFKPNLQRRLPLAPKMNVSEGSSTPTPPIIHTRSLGDPLASNYPTVTKAGIILPPQRVINRREGLTTSTCPPGVPTFSGGIPQRVGISNVALTFCEMPGTGTMATAVVPI